jgi:chromate transporter
MVLSMVGIMLPSTTLTWLATRWGHRNRERRSRARLQARHGAGGDRAAAGHRLGAGRAQGNPATDWPLWLLTAVCALLVWRTRLHLLWLLGAGALLGALGWV